MAIISPEIIKALRFSKKKPFTHEQMARYAGVTSKAYSGWEKGVGKGPTLTHYFRMCVGCHISPGKYMPTLEALKISELDAAEQVKKIK